MTTALDAAVTTALRRAAVRATCAPSIHNTQPWRFELRAHELRIVADPTRQLSVLDPLSRQLTISLGCALFNARVSLESAGLVPGVQRLPDPRASALMARLTIPDEPAPVGPGNGIGAYDSLLEQRHTGRDSFVPCAVPPAVQEQLQAAALAEHAVLEPVAAGLRPALARQLRRAEQTRRLDPAARAELRAWTATETPAAQDIDRDLDTAPDAGLYVLGTAADDVLSWLRAGEGLERVLLELTGRGYTARLLSDVAEVSSTRAALRAELGLAGEPHLVLRVGQDAGTSRSRRRRLVEVLHERS